MKKFIKRALFVFIMIMVWQIIYQFHLWPTILFPAPMMVIKTLVAGFQDKTFLIAIWITLKRLMIGYSLSIVVGILFGLFMGRFDWFEDTLGSLILGLQTLPSICWLPMAILWWGYSEQAIFFVTFMGSVLSITIATDFGVKNVPPLYIRAGRIMGANGFKLFRHVILPAAFPSILGGMKQGWSFAWRSLMAAELILSSLGLGYVLQVGRELLDTSQVIAVMIMIIVIGVIFDRGIFAPLEIRVRRKWGLIS